MPHDMSISADSSRVTVLWSRLRFIPATKRPRSVGGCAGRARAHRRARSARARCEATEPALFSSREK